MATDVVQCPHCGTLMHESARFCPGCGTPRTAVREQLEREAAATGVPYADLLDQARAEERRRTQGSAIGWAQTISREQTAPKRRNRIWVILAVVGGVLLLACVGCLVAGVIVSSRLGVKVGEGEAGEAAREQLSNFRGRWDRLHPAHQAVVSREEFAACSERLDLLNVQVLAEYDRDVDVPLVGPTGARAVVFTATTRDGQSVTDTVHMVEVGGEWVWFLSQDELDAYLDGRCP